MRMDEVVKEPLEKCLLYLAYQSDKADLDNMLYKEASKG